MRKSAPLDKIPHALEKTGFLLEHSVSEEFQKSNWSVIGNRYYVDDVDGKARELDLIAYRVKKSDELDVFTGVLVSCKKDVEHTWAFMSKDKPPHDPNVDWEPVHCWTDVEPLASFLNSCDWRKDYIQANKGVYSSLFENTRNVFATQLVSADGTAPKNDKPIFDSITGLFKALDHELGALPSRAKGKKRLYIFTLLTVVEAPLVDVQYHGNFGKAVEVDLLTHLARYMVRKRELSAHVHFVRSDKIKEFVETLSLLAEHAASHMTSLVNKSFEAVRTSSSVRTYLAKKLELKLSWRLNRILRSHGIDQDVTNLDLTYGERGLCIGVDVYEDAIDVLNKDVEAHKLTKEALRTVARYAEVFYFDSDVPF
jgi:hypothetical protein